jgi:hypothetical protein
MNNLGLQPTSFISVNGEDKEEISYRVTGLTADDICHIGYRGRGDHSEKQWNLEWRKGGVLVETPDRLYRSPDEALGVAQGIWDDMFGKT